MRAICFGLQVLTESGQDLGPITHVLFGPANDVYETPLALIPAVEGEFVVSVDLPARRLIVRDVPGLRKDE
jgi:ribosomal 30S subunit maturation factor RimM